METREASISPCGRYRYGLWRRWRPQGRGVLFLGLNPSTADGGTDDPTVRRCVGYARSWGFGWVSIGNLFGLRSRDPRALERALDPIGPGCDAALAELIGAASLVVAAWGVRGSLLGRDRAVLGLVRDPHCLAVTRGGQPGHPLYLPREAEPGPYKPAWRAAERASGIPAPPNTLHEI